MQASLFIDCANLYVTVCYLCVLSEETVKLFLPLARLAASTFCPFFVAILSL